MSNKLELSWSDFQAFILFLERAIRIGKKTYTGVYGIPRGGSIAAVVLSHRLNIPFLAAACDGCLVVDDIADSGETLKHYKDKKYDIATWVYKPSSCVMPDYFFRELEGEETDLWVVFPWEAAPYVEEPEYCKISADNEFAVEMKYAQKVMGRVENLPVEVIAQGNFLEVNYYVVNLGGRHPCCYVELPVGNKYHGVEYEDIPVTCHGGLTFSSASLSSVDPSGSRGSWFIGWDFGHCNDYSPEFQNDSIGDKLIKWTTPELVVSCKEVICQLFELQQKE